MALVRILIDGYSLLHAWPDLAPGRPRHSAAARDELIHVLTRYSDAIGTPISIVFDGASPSVSAVSPASARAIEVLYSRSGQTADQIIERVTHRMKPFGEVLAVTDDHAERDMVISLGGLAASCESFIRMVAQAFDDLDRDLASYNSREKRRYKRA